MSGEHVAQMIENYFDEVNIYPTHILAGSLADFVLTFEDLYETDFIVDDYDTAIASVLEAIDIMYMDYLDFKHDVESGN